MGNETTRRAFLAGAAGIAAAAVVPRVVWAADSPVFPHGVASGDPLPDRVIIWTQSDVTNSVAWQVATDAAFANIVRTGTAPVSPANDGTVHVDVDGLSPLTDYWYRFTANNATSAVGRMRTLPAPGATVDRVRMGVVTCAEWEFGAFGGYRLVAERDDLDVVLALGDYIYEFGTSYGGLPSPKPNGRVHRPNHELHTLADYRARYRQYATDPGQRALHHRHSVIAMYDDHEVANDWYRNGAQQHSADEGDWIARRNAALQAFREWLPIRVDPVDPLKVYRRFAFGNLAELFMLDERLYRDKQPNNAVIGYFSVDPNTDDPNRTMLGATQRDWLLSGLSQSTANWKVLGNPVSMMPIDVGPALAGVLSTALSALGTPLPPIPPPLLVEGWDGYNGERQKVFDFIDTKKIKDVVVLTGDYHESFATHLPVDRATWGLNRNSAAVEFIAPAITSPGLAETLQMGNLPQALTIDTVFEANLAASNPWVTYHEGFSHGYGVAEFRADGMQFDFWFLNDRNDPNTGARHAASYTVPRGASVLAATATPLGPRPPLTAAPAPATPQPVELIPRTGSEQSVAVAAGAAALGAAIAVRNFRGKLQEPGS